MQLTEIRCMLDSACRQVVAPHRQLGVPGLANTGRSPPGSLPLLCDFPPSWPICPCMAERLDPFLRRGRHQVRRALAAHPAACHPKCVERESRNVRILQRIGGFVRCLPVAVRNTVYSGRRRTALSRVDDDLLRIVLETGGRAGRVFFPLRPIFLDRRRAPASPVRTSSLRHAPPRG